MPALHRLNISPSTPSSLDESEVFLAAYVSISASLREVEINVTGSTGKEVTPFLAYLANENVGKLQRLAVRGEAHSMPGLYYNFLRVLTHFQDLWHLGIQFGISIPYSQLVDLEKLSLQSLSIEVGSGLATRTHLNRERFSRKLGYPASFTSGRLFVHLETLQISGSHVDILHMLPHFSLQTLKSLTIKPISHEGLLSSYYKTIEQLGEKSIPLTSLTFHEGSFNTTDRNSIMMLCKLSKLKILKLGSTQLSCTVEDVLLLVSSLPDLEELDLSNEWALPSAPRMDFLHQLSSISTNLRKLRVSLDLAIVPLAPLQASLPLHRLQSLTISGCFRSYTSDLIKTIDLSRYLDIILPHIENLQAGKHTHCPESSSDANCDGGDLKAVQKLLKVYGTIRRESYSSRIGVSRV